MNNNKSRNEVISLLIGAYGEMSDKQIMAYKSSLVDIPGPVMITSTQQIINTSKWLPKIAEIRTICKGMIENLEPLDYDFVCTFDGDINKMDTDPRKGG
jgi:hypothetical protein